MLLHASSCSSTIWYPNVKALSQKYTVYAIDLITEASKSTLLAPIKSQEQCAKWLDETLNGLGIQEFHLCGLSIGRWNATNYSSIYPRKVKKLILLSPVQTFAKMYKSYFIRIIKMGFKLTRKSVEEYLGWGSIKEAPLPDSVIEQFTIAALNINPNAVFPKMLNKKILRNLSMPVLVLFGENEFAFNIKKATIIAKSNIKNSEIEIVRNVSHLISISSPEFTNTRILRFLSK
ncbi:MAG: alpha/beta fold hydrolase [Lachnospiraceae bacterium]